MADDKKPNPPAHPTMANDGYTPIQKGWKPSVQGGYKPTVSEAVAKPPSGGSGVKPPPPSAKK